MRQVFATRFVWIAAPLIVQCFMLGASIAQTPAITMTSQSTQAEAEAAFDQAASRHRGEFADLAKKRGLSFGDNVATFASVSDKLRSSPKTVLLFYHHDGETLRVWALNRRGVAWESVDISKEELQAAIDGFRNDLGSLGYQLDRAPAARGLVFEDDPEERAKVSRGEISRLLLPGDITYLIRELGPESILVVPSLGIGSVPFGTLEITETENLMVDVASVTVLPSLFDTTVDSYRYGFDHERQPRALVVGNPEFFSDSDWLLPQLPGAEREAHAISTLFDSALLVGPDATAENVLENIREADIIYVATHGISSIEDPLDQSFLALAGADQDSSRLTAREIQQLDLRADLVVLSACQTGLGGVTDAGIIGLARAFKLAGASEVVVSLWNVDDEVTVELMTRFMNRYVEDTGLSAAGALRLAMDEVRAEFPNPLHWAPFVVINGEGSIVGYADQEWPKLLCDGSARGAIRFVSRELGLSDATQTT